MRGKAAVERAFGALRSLLFEHLPGYTGIDVADRGADPETDAVLTMAQMERLVAEWTVRVWRNRALGEHAPAWGPGEEHSPNTLFAAAMSQGGFALQVPRPELYYELLPAHQVKVHAQRGVKIGGLWYGRSDPALEPYEGKRSARGGRHKGDIPAWQRTRLKHFPHQPNEQEGGTQDGTFRPARKAHHDSGGPKASKRVHRAPNRPHVRAGTLGYGPHSLGGGDGCQVPAIDRDAGSCGGQDGGAARRHRQPGTGRVNTPTRS